MKLTPKKQKLKVEIMAIKVKELNKNYIPDMTHPYGSAWKQPSRDKILIDDKTAVMSKSDFDKLANYSHSVPSGVYEGKMWKGEYYENNKPTGKFYLRWFGLSSQPNMVSNHQRDIVII